MSKEITVANALSMWEEPQSLAEIKALFAPNLNDSEFKAFVGMGKASGLNPFLREIWAVKYDKSAPASYFIGRDGYRKAAQQQSDYDYHRVEAVYSEDEFENANGQITHKYKFGKRGVLLGAYCIVKRKSSSQEVFTSVLLTEYDKNFSVWKTMKETMIKKTAESQGLKASFQEVFAGTRDESEEELVSPPQISQTTKLKEQLKQEGFYADVKPVENPSMIVQSGDVYEIAISDDQIAMIEILMDEKGFDSDRKKKALKYFKVNTLGELNREQGDEFLEQLKKV